ncbi:glycosyltransferase family 4 protein [Flavobacterium sp. LS1R47]|uniref:Glycosyltransferase family 4 protein n=1 Tax=Flavobacterium frigoritolerans TaxID=2987686 RepID=A0A9X3HMK4_9FLAO|nr:glycosyltransferase family 4 protein [Flavobacterium frigoritolerans]MCV9933969.1 glycosyltransferase family 4 protein [Flavobacterium frigoritolerans]
MNKLRKLLIIGFVWPEPNSSAAGGRMMQLISIFQEQGFDVTFASPALDSDFMIDLTALGIEKKTIALNCSSFDNYIKELNPSVVLFDRFMIEEQFGWRVSENCPDALRILDTEDLHCLRHARQKAFKENRNFVVKDLFSEEIAKREIASILRCDLSLIISEFEMELLESVFKIDTALLYYLPFLLEPISKQMLDELPSFDERADFIFIGNFLHEPNWNTVQYLKESIWPLIKKQLPDAVLNIYGAYPSQKVLQLHHPKSGFCIMGRADNAQKVVRKARMVLAPIRFGAGLKGKLVEAMEVGTPSITTTIGAEAMNGKLPWNGFIIDDAEDIAKAAVGLYQDKNSWNEAQLKGIEIINTRYLKDNFATDFVKMIFYIQSNLQSHRNNNFIGSMLQYHTMRSTKYMSKWIEAKNKN